MSSVKMNAVHLPLRTEFFGILNPGENLDSLQSCQSSIQPWNKPLHIPTPRDSRPCRKLFLLKLQLPEVIRQAINSFLCILLIISTLHTSPVYETLTLHYSG